MHRVSVKKAVLKTLKIGSVSLASLLLLLFLLPVFFPAAVSDRIKIWTNNSITGELNFSKARLSFFKHFPSLTLTLYDFSLKGEAPFQQDTLVAANEVSLGVDLGSLFSKSISIDRIYLTGGNIHVLVDAEGHPNYNVYQSAAAAQQPAPDSAGASLKIEHIEIAHCNIIYDDRSLPIYIRAKDVNYTGKGDLSKAQFDLYSQIHIASLDLSYNGTSYILSKQLNGELITKINTQSLDLIFEKNNLKINQLPVKLNGSFGFLKNGYRMDFRLSTVESGLRDIFSALPPEYVTWLEHTDVQGTADVNATLTGEYIAATNTMPDVTFNMKVRDGMIANANPPAPLKNLFLNFQAALPQLNTDSLTVNVDSVFFNIDKDYFSSVVHVKGLKVPDIHVRMNTDIDLEKWNRAIGLKSFDLKGRLQAELEADGKYEKTVVVSGLQHRRDTVISSIPAFQFRSVLSNGYFKAASLPQAVSNISCHITASCPDHKYEHVQLDMSHLNAALLHSYIKGHFKVNNLQAPLIDAGLASRLQLEDMKQFCQPYNLDLTGELQLDVTTKGRYVPAKRQFPVTTARLAVNNGTIQTKYYPKPVEKINVDATVINTNGKLQSLSVLLKPLAFQFEGQPFTVQAKLNNFDNLRYNITSEGILNLGNIYRVFAIKGYGVKGFIKTNLSLSGTESDAKAGRYQKLNNKGTLAVRDIALSSELFPKPLYLKDGLFRFDQEKMWFDRFNASYGKSDFILNGFLNNVIGYAIQKNQRLRGTFDLKSNYILVDELMINGSADHKPATNNKAAAPSGVVMIPSDLSLTLNATAGKVMFRNMAINNFYGQLVIDSSKLRLSKTGFVIIGAPVEMEATYESLKPQKAAFDYRISAKEFDIKRAYNEIQLFHDMATSAGSASGLVGLDYHLSGRLDENMSPVYPSLKGEGVLSVKKIKMKGFRLFNAVGKTTGRTAVQDPELSKIEIKSAINNNIITIERTKMRVAGFRPRFEGEVSFDGRLNLKGRLGLPPLGIIGIPLSVTGTQSNPKVKLRKGSDKDKLDETEDTDD